MPTARNDANKAMILQFWDDLYHKDFEKLAACFTEDGRYEDVPVPEGDAVGPAAVARKLRIGLGRIDHCVHHLHRMLAEGDTVVTEHTEDWHFDSDHVVSLPFVSVHVIHGGKITLWRDYWNLPTLMAGAPQWWIEHITAAWQEP